MLPFLRYLKVIPGICRRYCLHAYSKPCSLIAVWNAPSIKIAFLRIRAQQCVSVRDRWSITWMTLLSPRHSDRCSFTWRPYSSQLWRLGFAYIGDWQNLFSLATWSKSKLTYVRPAPSWHTMSGISWNFCARRCPRENLQAFSSFRLHLEWDQRSGLRQFPSFGA